MYEPEGEHPNLGNTWYLHWLVVYRVVNSHLPTFPSTRPWHLRTAGSTEQIADTRPERLIKTAQKRRNAKGHWSHLFISMWEKMPLTLSETMCENNLHDRGKSLLLSSLLNERERGRERSLHCSPATEGVLNSNDSEQSLGLVAD